MAAAAIFLCAGLSLASFVLLAFGQFTLDFWADDLILASPGLFLCACILVFMRAKLGYVLGGTTAAAALPWFVLTESSFLPSIWMSLNRPQDFEGDHHVPFAVLEILCVADPLGRPWMLPVIVDGVETDPRVLHVLKHGLQFHETTVISWNRHISIMRNDRRLFQYRFQNRNSTATMPAVLEEQVKQVVHSPGLLSRKTPWPIPLRSWDAEGWYVAVDGSPFLAFTTEYGTAPPPEIKDLFEQIEKLPGPEHPITMADVCLGFCYDPISGLGFWYSNNRCQNGDRAITCR